MKYLHTYVTYVCVFIYICMYLIYLHTFIHVIVQTWTTIVQTCVRVYHCIGTRHSHAFLLHISCRQVQILSRYHMESIYTMFAYPCMTLGHAYIGLPANRVLKRGRCIFKNCVVLLVWGTAITLSPDGISTHILPRHITFLATQGAFS